ncbi:MAG: oxidoreductase [Verrucomicrobia bacterium]|nr:MAG: oxidoreductase [Verrucomicrobiota bacterium]
MLNENSFKDLKANLRGGLIEPSDNGYDEARKVYNGMIHKKPRAIARCTDVADVIRSVNFARENNLLLAIRGGGHNAGGLGICDDGLVIDLGLMKYSRVDPAARTVTVGGGCTWGDVDHATHVFGLATPSGIISTTGVGGLTLGGGVGHLTRKCGLTIDNLLSADVVLADGRFVKANADENSDLFWAIRGGGGNFGVITAFTFKLHPIDILYGGPMLYELSEATDVMKWYRDLIPAAPDDLNGFFAFLTVPPAPPFPEHLHLKKMCGVVWTYAGPQTKAEETFKPIRAFKKPALDFVGPLPQPALQTMFDALYPPGLQWYWRADFVNELSDDAIAQHARFGAALPSMHSTIHMYPINGAASRVGKNDTAWNYRDATWAQVMVGVDPDPANNEKIISWTKSYYDALHPYSAGGAYVNFLMGDEGEDRVKKTYGDNYERLIAVKNKYDPGNLFRVNQNIKPSDV